jgi:hypothetical protein
MVSTDFIGFTGFLNSWLGSVAFNSWFCPMQSLPNIYAFMGKEKSKKKECGFFVNVFTVKL